MPLFYRYGSTFGMPISCTKQSGGEEEEVDDDDDSSGLNSTVRFGILHRPLAAVEPFREPCCHARLCLGTQPEVMGVVKVL